MEKITKYGASLSLVNVDVTRLQWAGDVARMGDARRAHKLLLGKPDRKSPKLRWEDNIIWVLKEVEYKGEIFIQIFQKS